MGKLRIREICEQRGVRHSALAELIELNPSSFSVALKRESFSIEQLTKIADFLKVHIADLFIDLDAIRGSDFAIFLYKDGELTRFTSVSALQKHLSKNV